MGDLTKTVAGSLSMDLKDDKQIDVVLMGWDSVETVKDNAMVLKMVILLIINM